MNTITIDTGAFEMNQKLAGLVSREYCKEFLRLLYIYHDISASEASTHLEIHIKTAQDFLDGMTEHGILLKRRAAENKRPYFRYSLKAKRINFSLNLDSMYDLSENQTVLQWSIRERKNSGAVFKEGRGSTISSIIVYQGKGRSRKERTINLTSPQGQFLYRLPFPTEATMTVDEICAKAEVGDDYLPEVLHIVTILKANCVIECA